MTEFEKAFATMTPAQKKKAKNAIGGMMGMSKKAGKKAGKKKK